VTSWRGGRGNAVSGVEGTPDIPQPPIPPPPNDCSHLPRNDDTLSHTNDDKPFTHQSACEGKSRKSRILDQPTPPPDVVHRLIHILRVVQQGWLARCGFAYRLAVSPGCIHPCKPSSWEPTSLNYPILVAPHHDVCDRLVRAVPPVEAMHEHLLPLLQSREQRFVCCRIQLGKNNCRQASRRDLDALDVVWHTQSVKLPVSIPEL
jgi:hypothetical protein